MNKTVFIDYVRSKLVDIDDPELSEQDRSNIEFVVDISNPDHHKLEIDLKHNSTRAHEQKRLREEIIDKEKALGTYESRIDKNVLVLYIDNLSRAHSIEKCLKLQSG